MNPAQLLSHFDRIGEAPEAIPRLRRFILDLAVRGKLVEQDPRDEPASELLKRIEAEKAWLVEEGKIRKQEPTPQVTIEDQPFELPTNWQWVRFGALANFSAGRTPSRHDFSFWNTGDYPWVSIADMRDGEVVAATKETVSAKAQDQVFSSEPVPIGTMIMSFKLTIGKISRLGVPAFHNEAIISIYPHLLAMDAYLFKVLPQFSRKGDTKDAIKGATLNRESITNILLPLPPLAEQHRIVAKVDELMALCERLEAAQTERESRRDRLVASSLHHLNNGGDPDAFREHARFYFNHLPRLTTRLDHIKQLRQTILNLAVRGKLVEQDPSDEPANVLLVKIAREKQRLMKKGKENFIKINPEPRKGLPIGWENVFFQDITKVITCGMASTPKYCVEGRIFLSAKNVKPYRFMPQEHKLVDEKTYKKITQNAKPEKGDILLTRVGAGIGEAALIDQEIDFAFYVSLTLIKPFLDFLNSKYLLHWLNSPEGVKKSLDSIYGGKVSQGNLNVNQVRGFVVPIPPLNEQHRIVAKVDELMALCDQLETQLTTTQSESQKLLEAILHDALALENK